MYAPGKAPDSLPDTQNLNRKPQSEARIRAPLCGFLYGFHCVLLKQYNRFQLDLISILRGAGRILAQRIVSVKQKLLCEALIKQIWSKLLSL
jgi:hypothetical protein